MIIDPTRPLTNYKLLDDMMLELAGVRATAMEGSFGTQKEHYDLRRVKARTKRTEILYIFFGIHTGKHSRKYVRHIKFDCNLHQCDAGCSLFMGVILV